MTGLRIAFARWDQGAMKLLLYAAEKVRGAISLMSAPAALVSLENKLSLSVGRTGKSLLAAGDDDGANFLVIVVFG